jgi:hypothetical protein
MHPEKNSDSLLAPSGNGIVAPGKGTMTVSHRSSHEEISGHHSHLHPQHSYVSFCEIRRSGFFLRIGSFTGGRSKKL